MTPNDIVINCAGETRLGMHKEDYSNRVINSFDWSIRYSICLVFALLLHRRWMLKNISKFQQLLFIRAVLINKMNPIKRNPKTLLQRINIELNNISKRT